MTDAIATIGGLITQTGIALGVAIIITVSVGVFAAVIRRMVS